ncbi:MAG: MFS transporter [Terracidiphilus sp.]
MGTQNKKWNNEVLSNAAKPRFFYGWWITAAAFLNLFFSTGLVYYGLPVYYPSMIAALGFTRAQLTQGFLVGFLLVGAPASLLAGVLIDRFGARPVILSGVGLIGIPLILMGSITHYWQYETLCMVEVMGYALAGPIANQVLISKWFDARRGQAMGYAYLGLGLGGVVSPILASFLIQQFGWRLAFHAIGTAALAVLFPVGLLITRSTPGELGLLPDGAGPSSTPAADAGAVAGKEAVEAVRTLDFWLILAGSTLVLSAIHAVIQHFILFLRDQNYALATASRVLSTLLTVSLAGRVLVGYVADRFQRKNTMALFYLILGCSIPLLFLVHRPIAAWTFATIFGFAMGADYMLIPLVIAERFGIGSLGKLIALVVTANSLFQWVAAWAAGRLFDAYHNYNWAWMIMSGAGLLGAIAIYAVSVPTRVTAPAGPGLRLEHASGG